MTETPELPAQLSIEARSAILQEQIHSYLGKGYRVMSQTATTAQLATPPKRGSCLLYIVTLGIYLIWRLIKGGKSKAVYIEIDVYGNVIKR
jgi:hypothetical protein